MFNNVNKNRNIWDLSCVDIRKKRKCIRSTTIAGHPPLPNKRRRGRQVSTSFMLVEGQTTLKSLTILCLNKTHSKHAFSVPRLWNLKWAPYRYHKHVVIKELLNVTCIKAERREIQHQRLKPSRVGVCWLKLQSWWNQAPSPWLEENPFLQSALPRSVYKAACHLILTI